MTNNKLNILHYSIDAEQAVLGALIIDNDCWDVVSKTIIKTDFYVIAHQILFDSIEIIFNECNPVDKVILSNFLLKKNIIDKVGGLEYIDLIIKNTPSSKNVLSYLNIIKDKSILRNIISTNKDIIDYALSNKPSKIEDIIDYAEEKIMSISKRYKYKGNFVEGSMLLSKVIKRIENLYHMKSPIVGLSSGFKELDDITFGFNKSDLIIIAGRPSMGKTAFAISISKHIIIDLKKPLLIFSMEMTASQVIERMISSVGRINLQTVRNGMIESDVWPRLSSAVTLLSRSQFFICDGGPLDLFDIKSISRKLFSLNKDLSAIIIDYIQLIKITGSYNNRVQELSEISRSLKSLAGELDIPIIALSQLNRGLEQRVDKRPIMSDIRESGAIEQDADLIIFIYRDEVYNKNSKYLGKAEIIISKQRNGPLGEFKLDFLSEYATFDNLNKDLNEYWKDVQ